MSAASLPPLIGKAVEQVTIARTEECAVVALKLRDGLVLSIGIPFDDPRKFDVQLSEIKPPSPAP